MGCVALPWDPPPPSALVTKHLISGVVGNEQYKMAWFPKFKPHSFRYNSYEMECILKREAPRE